MHFEVELNVENEHYMRDIVNIITSSMEGIAIFRNSNREWHSFAVTWEDYPS